MKKRYILVFVFLIILILGCIFVEVDFTNFDMGIGIPSIRLRNYFKGNEEDIDTKSAGAEMSISPIEGMYNDSLLNKDSNEYVDIYQDERVKELCKDMNDKRYQYEALETNKEKKCYELIESSIFNICSECKQSGIYPIKRIFIPDEQFDDKEIKNAMYAVESDNPFIFWISDVFSFAYNGKGTIIELRSIKSPEECKWACENINNVIKKVNESIYDYELKRNSNIDSDFYKELYIHDFIIGRCDYDNKVDNINDSWSVFTAYGALVDRKAVCEGYSKATKLLLNKNGISCRLITGKSGNVLHMWNMVKINNDWYHLDVTWDESNKNVKYNYFNVTDEMINLDHQISYNEYGNKYLPKCINDSFNYFNVKAHKIYALDAISDESIVNKLVTLVNNNEYVMTIMICEGLDYKSTINKMFYESPYKFFYYVKEANKRLNNSRQIDYSNMRISLCDHMKSAIIKLSLK